MKQKNTKQKNIKQKNARQKNMNPKNIKQQLEQLDENYTKVWGEKEELAYELAALKARSRHVEEQDEQIRTLHESVRRLKHDMKNHMLVLAAYLNEGAYESAKKYTSGIIDQLNAIHSYIETDNSLLNHILNRKLTLARTEGITIKAEIDNLGFAVMEGMDFTALLSNLLDNAIEACAREAVKELWVIIAPRRGYEAIIVKNRVGSSVLEDNPGLCSGKPEKEQHGLGVGQIRALVDKYGGVCDFYEEDGFFCACAFIPK